MWGSAIVLVLIGELSRELLLERKSNRVITEFIWTNPSPKCVFWAVRKPKLRNTGSRTCIL